jgi:hypothetical protein
MIQLTATGLAFEAKRVCTPMSMPIIHDAEVVGISHDAAKTELRLECRAAAEAFVLVFMGAKAWRLSEFQEQNVLFAVCEYGAEVWLTSEEGTDEFYSDLRTTIESTDLVFHLESSVGLEGAVVAASCRLERAQPPL